MVDALELENPATDRGARLRRQATNASVTVAATLSAAKVVAWLVTDSVTILSSLLDSMVDMVASLVILLSVRHAMRPPDRSHRFGHGKAEPLGALAQAAFIIGSGLFLVFEAASRVIDPQPIARTGVGIAIMVFALVMTAGLVLFQRHVIKVTGSLAIGADSVNYRGDLFMGLAVIGTLILSDWADARWLDPVVALGIAAYLFYNAVTIGRRALDVLMDRELPREDRERIQEVVMSDDRVEGMHDLRTRNSGTTQFIELHLELDGALSLADAHDITDSVEQALQNAFPAAEVIVHQEPAGLEDERLDRRIARPRKG